MMSIEIGLGTGSMVQMTVSISDWVWIRIVIMSTMVYPSNWGNLACILFIGIIFFSNIKTLTRNRSIPNKSSFAGIALGIDIK
jgi:hypothetical protein